MRANKWILLLFIFIAFLLLFWFESLAAFLFFWFIIYLLNSRHFDKELKESADYFYYLKNKKQEQKETYKNKSTKS